MTMQARESEYLRIIAEKYNSKDPEDTLLTSQKENALQTEEYATIHTQVDTNEQEKNIEAIMGELGRIGNETTTRDEIIETNESDEEAEREIPDNFLELIETKSVENNFRALTKARIVDTTDAGAIEHTEISEFDYIGALNSSQIEAFRKCADNSLRKVILVGKPGTGKDFFP
ncbi:MAG: hypothetical protein MHMPM18_004987 [Marteilia pararefringens]